jgi:eukaryotic-like serine/threonine-protein kinase
VSGDSPTTACNILGQKGYTCGSTSYQSSSSVSQGSVISTSPAAGTQYASGNTVNLIVSSGPSTIPVPSVIGETYGQAKSDIRNAGLSPGNDGSCVADSNTVSNQSPTSGTQSAPGATVTLSCSSSSSTTTSTAPTTGVFGPNDTGTGNGNSGNGNGNGNGNNQVNSFATTPADSVSPGGSGR